MAPVLRVNNLRVEFSLQGRQLTAVDGLHLRLEQGECLGVVGESGSGKSQSFLAIMGLLAPNGRATGSVLFNGEELVTAPRSRLDQLRGNRISMVFQDALSGLTPNMRIGVQLEEIIMAHNRVARRQARSKALQMLEAVNIPDLEQRRRCYPFELSGGMRQRVMIAMALACGPDVLICDEPTTALDVTVQAQILKLIDGLRRDRGTAVVFISHDMGVVASVSDRILIMYAGRAVEVGDTSTVLQRPAHPYTEGLLRSIPSFNSDPNRPLFAIPGHPADPGALPTGCSFSARCPRVGNACYATPPELEEITMRHRVACFRRGKVAAHD